MTHVCLAASMVLALIATGASASEVQAPAALAGPCSICHGTGGRSPGSIPSIDALDGATMAAMLRGFKTGEIEGTVMNRIARGYTDAEIEAIAHHFAGRDE